MKLGSDRCERGIKAREKEIIVVDRNSYHLLIFVIGLV